MNRRVTSHMYEDPHGPASPWIRHRPWLVPLLGVMLSVLISIGANVYATRFRPESGRYLTLGAVSLGAVAATLVLMVVALVKGGRVWRAYRRSRGCYTKAEAVAGQQRIEAERGWAIATFLSVGLSAGQVPDAGKVWDVVLTDGECLMADLQASYARYYSSDVRYSHATGVFFGRTSLVAVGYGLTAWGNRSRRRAAQAAGQIQWREHQHVRVVMTDQRLICFMSDGRVLSFYHQGVVAIYPEPENWSLVLDFSDTSALCLSGAGGPAAAVVAVWAAYGPEGVQNHPGLAPLRA